MARRQLFLGCIRPRGSSQVPEGDLLERISLVARRRWCGATTNAKVRYGLTPRGGCCECVWELDQRQCGAKVARECFRGSVEVSLSRVFSCCRALPCSVFNLQPPSLHPGHVKTNGVAWSTSEEKAGCILMDIRAAYMNGHNY